MSVSGDSDLSPEDPVDVVNGVGQSRRESLEAAGYETVGDLQTATIGDLVQIVRANAARQIKEQVGNGVGPQTTAAAARERAQKIPGAKAKVVKQDGRQVPKVLRKVDERREDGATITIHKG